MKEKVMALQGIKTLFHNLQAKRRSAREAKACKKAAFNAIAARDPEGLRKALGAMQPVEISSDMMFDAIQNGDLKTFKELLAFTDPNTTLTREEGVGRFSYTAKYSPLNYALKVRSHDIVMALATDPRTDIEKTFRYIEKPLIEARGAGMQDVAAVLAQRTAELRRQEAAQLDKEAGQLDKGDTAKPPPALKAKFDL
jgi:hypothetical protein